MTNKKLSKERQEVVITLLVLSLTLLLVKIVQFPCFVKLFTGISCPFCGMTRAFNAILHFDLFEACYQNIFSVPLFILLIFSIFMIIVDFIKNRFKYLPNFLSFFKSHIFIFILSFALSFIFNNIKS